MLSVVFYIYNTRWSQSPHFLLDAVKHEHKTHFVSWQFAPNVFYHETDEFILTIIINVTKICVFVCSVDTQLLGLTLCLTVR